MDKTLNAALMENEGFHRSLAVTQDTIRDMAGQLLTGLRLERRPLREQVMQGVQGADDAYLSCVSQIGGLERIVATAE